MRVFLLVAYKNEREVSDFIKRAEFTDAPTRFLVASNSPTPAELDSLDGVADVLAWFPDNPGYLASAIRVLEMDSKGPSRTADWIILSNTDLEFSHLRLEGWLDGRDAREPQILGPDVVGADGRRMNPYLRKRPSSISLLMRSLVFTFAPTYAIAKRRALQRRRPETSPSAGGCYAVHGSMVVFSGASIWEMMSELKGAPLFSEEILIGDLASEQSVPVRFEPSFSVAHSGGSTTSSLGAHRGRVNAAGLLFSLKKRIERRLA